MCREWTEEVAGSVHGDQETDAFGVSPRGEGRGRVSRHRTSIDHDSKVDLDYLRQLEKVPGREVLVPPDVTSRNITIE